MKESASVFFTYSEKVRMNHKHLYKTYKENIGTFNQLRLRSKHYMNQLVDVENDLAGKEGDHEDVSAVLANLIGPISEFNEQIDEQLSTFQKAFDAMSENLEQLLVSYSGAEGEMSELLAVRRSTMYLNLLVEKLKNEVSSLQLMNNVLFAFYHQLSAEVVDEYKKKLSLVLSFLQRLASSVKNQIKRVESIS